MTARVALAFLRIDPDDENAVLAHAATPDDFRKAQGNVSRHCA
jgi:hypothetical protein